MKTTPNSNNTICFTGDRNTEGKNDFTGAFLPECNAFMKTWGLKTHKRINLGNNNNKRKEELFKELREFSKNGKLENIIFFCHGLPKSVQFGLTNSNLKEFAKLLRELIGQNSTDINIILYCCSTGSSVAGTGSVNQNGDGGFADSLRDALCQEGFVDCRVMGHAESGHTTKNPTKRFFDGLGSPFGGSGGQWIVAPKTTQFKKWRELLQTDARFKVPFMSIAEIHKLLK